MNNLLYVLLAAVYFVVNWSTGHTVVPIDAEDYERTVKVKTVSMS